MGSIKPKIGQCEDCPPDAPAKPLTKNKCNFHYRIYLNRRSQQKKANNKTLQNEKKELQFFFASQIIQTPERCEECGAPLAYWKKTMPAAIIAHILPKRKSGGFPAVATHPKNRLFLCPTPCHADFDNKGEDYGAAMKCLPVMQERFKEFKHLLSESDLQRLPKYLQNV